MDLDKNEYPDIVVGAYDSNNAVYLKSAPVVHLGNYWLPKNLPRLILDICVFRFLLVFWFLATKLQKYENIK